MNRSLRNESLNSYEHELELELDGAVEVRPAQMAAGGALLVVAVILTALNLRPAITSIGPVLGEMRESLGPRPCGPVCSRHSPDCASRPPA
ncbi:transmembrane transporter [Mycolicibacterium fortuitum]|uniref:Transmembrane transporter n=1 Tax=Mycolicibacterium fortuitum TaxID=1766 RepID=A0A378U8I0_MYCFO|nr:transmembrane transporter [Mycolicibacterium fortuitum]